MRSQSSMVVATDPQQALTEAQAALAQALHCHEVSDHQAGQVAAQQALALAQQALAPELQAQAGAVLALHLHRNGEVEAALAQGRQALNLMPEQVDGGLRARLLSTLALSCDQLDLPVDALDYALAALDCARQAGEAGPVCMAMCRVATAYVRMSDPVRADTFAQQSLELARLHRDEEQMFRALNTLVDSKLEQGDTLARSGEHEAARRCFVQALACSDEAVTLSASSGELYRANVGRINHGVVLLKLARAEEALAEFDQALAVAQSHGFELMISALFDMRAQALMQLNRLPEAIDLMERALSSIDVHEDPGAFEKLHEHLYEAHKRQGDLAKALLHHERLRELERLCFRQRESTQLRVLLTKAELERSRVTAERAEMEAQIQRLRAFELQVERDALAAQAHELGRHAAEDALTGLPNRRAMDLQLATLFAANDDQASAAPWSLAVLDLDHFKHINDHFGHAVGDDVLRAVGSLLSHGLRPPDVVGRMGGEEFLILLRNTPLQQALPVCERLRQLIESHDWAALAPAVGGQSLRVTASLGVCRVMPGEDMRSALERADSAMYRAKQSGRNQVVAQA